MGLKKTDIIGIIGAGAMGAGIAQIAAMAGHKILLNDINPEAANKSIKTIEKHILRLVEKTKITKDVAQLAIKNLHIAPELQDLKPAKLIIEAAVENLSIKREIFAKLEDICATDTILSTNTSSLSINTIASGMQRPQNIAGLHFFNPAPIMRLVEVISGLKTAPKTAQILYDTAVNWGKIPVYAKSTPGFIVNRVARAFYGEALNLLNENAADAATIDTLLKACGGFPMGPIELMDLIGHDVNYAVSCSVYDAYYGDARFKPSLVQKALVDAGMLGRKSGQGFYNHAKNADKPINIDKPSAKIALPQKPPIKCYIYNSHMFNHNLLALLQNSKLDIERLDDKAKHGILLPSGVYLMLTRGKLATQEAAIIDAPVIVIDLCQDYVTTSHIAIAASDNCKAEQLNEAVGFLQALGKQVVILADIAGLAVMRTVAMLANEAADAVNQNVATVKDVDLAMKNGVNYPKGPLQWADEIGTKYLAEILDNMEAVYGETRYRLSPLMRRKATLGAKFYT